MKTPQRTHQSFVRAIAPATTLVLATALIMLQVSCGSFEKRVEVEKEKERAASGKPPGGEISLQADRSKYADLRKEIPTEVRKENDELALLLQVITQKDHDEEPGKIRDRFNKIIRDRRTILDRDLRKKREDYNREEKKKREEFLAKLKDERDHLPQKTTADQRREFFADQDRKRNDYFADERDHRKDFESHLMEKRKDFEDMVREKTNQFNQEMHAYTATYYERQKNLALKKRIEEKQRRGNGLQPAAGTGAGTIGAGGASIGGTANGANLNGTPVGAGNGTGPSANGFVPGASGNPLDEFEQIPKGPGTPLGPSDQ